MLDKLDQNISCKDLVSIMFKNLIPYYIHVHCDLDIEINMYHPLFKGDKC